MTSYQKLKEENQKMQDLIDMIDGMRKIYEEAIVKIANAKTLEKAQKIAKNSILKITFTYEPQWLPKYETK